MHYTATSQGNRTVVVSNEQMGIIGQLEYEVWFPNKATASVADMPAYRFAPTGFWNATIAVTKLDAPYASIETKWGEGLVIHLETGKTLRFKRRGFFATEYVLLDDQEAEVASIRSNFNWSHLSFDYELEAADQWLDHELVVALPFLLTYGMRFMRMRHAAVA